MAELPPTREDVAPDRAPPRAPRPGVLVVFSGGAPCLRALPLDHGYLKLGRELIDDELMSREHAEVELAKGVWHVRDLGSRNGTFVDGARIDTANEPAPRVIRIGHTLCAPVADIAGDRIDRRGGMIVGPTLRAALDRVDRAGRNGDTLLLHGESGTGKELAARAFHDASARSRGPFVAVNCAAIPEGVAERLLFGAVKGAYSGADEAAQGYVQAADGGTLFLDEIAELDAAVQAKLLRVLESREVTALGAATARPVSLGVVSATHADLREAVGAGAFREDLYFRIGQPSVALPPLRERVEEIPHLIAHQLDGLVAHAQLVEACMLRAWPGNVRELLGEIDRAGHSARDDGRTEVIADDLDPSAGVAFAGAGETDAATPDRQAIAAALSAAGGNVSAAARTLGVHRTQLRRWIKKHGL